MTTALFPYANLKPVHDHVRHAHGTTETSCLDARMGLMHRLLYVSEAAEGTDAPLENNSIQNLYTRVS